MYKKIYLFVLSAMLFFICCSNDIENENSCDDGVENTPYGIEYLYSSSPNVIPVVSTKASILKSTRWMNGDIIKIKFLEQDEDDYSLAMEKVKDIALEWTKYANLTFDFVDYECDADVKLAFNWGDEKTVWSEIGTDCKIIAQDQPSANLVLYRNIEEEINTKSFRQQILNTFGHIIGLINEHQGSDSQVKLDPIKAGEELKKRMWSDKRINDFLNMYDEASLNSSEFDPESVMLWYFPTYITQDGKHTSFNCELSKIDISFIRTMYPGQIPKEVELVFKLQKPNTSTTENILSYSYKGVRIGEYYWVNNNFYHEVPRDYNDLIGWENETPITQSRLDKYVSCVRIDPSLYQINIADFNKYYGIYYCRASVDYMTKAGWMLEDGVRTGWELPTGNDFRQLFAMCPISNEEGILDEADVRFALSAHENSNPLAFNVWGKANPFNIYWFYPKSDKINIYNFNMMPSGEKLNGDSYWGNGLGTYWGERGDLMLTFYTSMFFTKRDHVTIHDALDTNPDPIYYSYHWFPVRWCRKLSDEELGYKLYINSAQNDIIKLALNDPIPSGYKELPKGYLRGFYVLYILDNPSPKYTIAQIIEMSKKVDDPELNRID